jgi:hypothetical protein
MGVSVVRVFVRLKCALVSNTALARRIDELELEHRCHGDAIKAMLSRIHGLMSRCRRLVYGHGLQIARVILPGACR